MKSRTRKNNKLNLKCNRKFRKKRICTLLTSLVFVANRLCQPRQVVPTGTPPPFIGVTGKLPKQKLYIQKLYIYISRKINKSRCEKQMCVLENVSAVTKGTNFANVARIRQQQQGEQMSKNV